MKIKAFKPVIKPIMTAAIIKARMGVSDALLRVSVGFEDLEDLQADLARGLDALAGRAAPRVASAG